MGYIGITCDKAKAQGREYLTRAECNECVLDPAHPCPFNAKMLMLLWGDEDHEPKNNAFSPTRVQGCPRKRYLAKRSEYKEILNPYTAYNALRGHFVHNFFEHTKPAPGILFDISEVRFSTMIDTKYGPIEFAGKPDLIEVKYHDEKRVVVKVTDWKSSKDVRKATEIKTEAGDKINIAKESHALQVNMYAYLLWRELPKYLKTPGLEVLVDELEIVYLDMGKVRRFTSKCSLLDRGKLLTPRRDKNYEMLDLMQLSYAKLENLERWLVRTIEEAIEAEDTIYPPYEGQKAALCDYCSFQEACRALWVQQQNGEVA